MCTTSGDGGRGRQPGNIPTLVPPSCGMEAEHQNGVTAGRVWKEIITAISCPHFSQNETGCCSATTGKWLKPTQQCESQNFERHQSVQTIQTGILD
ncbi:hypothetical protein T265_07957 [Opisthorchis viverrini]|uniref:Uncharacterized protein n=1 Tax=Opisthorchis viverrini TaxID=6198 RepID=A0A075A9X9_OPIVI|nr:hypothetical protein T265_07957 [Opisthorchis viverrini]KER24354.1 hypothetical protein T265_07957 [Opisthorchis viverrini]